jgi:hypothetical protein
MTGFTELPPDLEELAGLFAECIVGREEGNEMKHDMLSGKLISPDFRFYSFNGATQRSYLFESGI